MHFYEKNFMKHFYGNYFSKILPNTKKTILKESSLRHFLYGIWDIFQIFFRFPYARFFISDNFMSNVRLKLGKNQAKAKQHPEAEKERCL